MEQELSELLRVRREKLQKLKESGINPYPYKFDRTHLSSEILDEFDSLSSSESIIRAAGRLVSWCGHGKTSFAHIQDQTGKIQIYARKDDLGDETYEILGLLV